MEQTVNIGFADFIANLRFTDASLYSDKLVVADMQWMPEDKARAFTMRLDAFTIIMVERGELVMNVNYVPCRVQANSFLVLIERHVVRPVSASRDFKGYHIVATHDFTRGAMGDEKPPMMAVNPLLASPVMQMDEDEFAVLRDDMERLRRHIHRNEHAYQEKLVQNALAELLFEIWNFTMQKADGERMKPKATSRENVVAGFFDLLFKHSRTQHEVAFYAAKLCVTPIYLLRAIKHVTGMPALKVINDMILTDAKILLRRPNLTIQQVAEELHFSDQASFSKFFKKNTGEVPMEFKRKAR